MPKYSSTQIDEALQELLADEPVATDESMLIGGKFQILEILEISGQATVVLATDLKLHRRVVLKIYHDSLSEQQKTRVINEGRALARIQNPYVVQCYGVDEFEGTLFLVLEYVEGRSLAEQLSKASIDFNLLERWFRQLVIAVDAAHHQGVLHLDLSPDNVLVTAKSDVKLIDFGLVQTILGSAGSGSGTPAFMAPELANKSEQVDQRADVFGLGAILYFALCRKAPFQDDSIAEQRSLAKIGKVKPLSQSITPWAPNQLVEICNKCVQQNPEDRFASAGEILSLLKPQRHPDTRRSLVYSAFIAFAVIIACAILLRQSALPTFFNQLVTPASTLVQLSSVDLPASGTKASSAISDSRETGWQAKKLRAQLLELRNKADEAIVGGNWELAVETYRQASELSKHQQLEVLYRKEYTKRLNFLLHTWPKLELTQQARFRECFAKIVKLRTATEKRDIQCMQSLLGEMANNRTINMLETTVGEECFFTLYARDLELRGHDILSINNIAPSFDLRQATKKLVDQWSAMLGPTSDLALYGRESVAQQLQLEGRLTESERYFSDIFLFTMEHPRQMLLRELAASIQRDRATTVYCLIDPEEAIRLFQFYEEYQKSISDGSFNIELAFYKLPLLVYSMEYRQCIDLGEQLLAEMDAVQFEDKGFLKIGIKATLAAACASLANELPAGEKRLLIHKSAAFANAVELMLGDVPWQVGLFVKSMMAHRYSALEDWDAAIREMSETIELATRNVSKHSGDQLPPDGVVHLRAVKINYCNVAGRTHEARRETYDLAELIDKLTEKRERNLFNLIAWKAMTVAYANAGESKSALRTIETALEELRSLESEQFTGNWQESKAWFTQKKAELKRGISD